MSLFVALGISIGVLAGLWGVVCTVMEPIFAISAPFTFIAWACFYAAGGKTDGMVKTLCSNLTGLIYGFLIALVAGLLGSLPFGLGLGIGLLIFVFCMCVQANVSYLSFIPGTVIGASVFFAAGANNAVIPNIAVAFVCGAVLGLISEMWANKMAKTPDA